MCLLRWLLWQKKMILSGANELNKNKQLVDSLNVFPVPDGDTGTNMSMTIGAGAKELAALADDTPIAEVARTCAATHLKDRFVIRAV